MLRLSKLAELDLSHNHITNPFIFTDKVNRSILEGLKFLNLSFNEISDEGSGIIKISLNRFTLYYISEPIFSSDFLSLISINLNFNEIWEPISEFMTLSLIILELSNNRITDAGARKLFAFLTPQHKLLKLDLQRNKINDPVRQDETAEVIKFITIMLSFFFIYFKNVLMIKT